MEVGGGPHKAGMGEDSLHPTGFKMAIMVQFVFLGGFLQSFRERMTASLTWRNKAILLIHSVEMVLYLNCCPDDLEQCTNNKNGRSQKQIIVP